MESDATDQEDSGETTPPALSFSALEEKVSLYLPDDAEPLIDREDRIATAATAISVLFVTIGTALKPSGITVGVVFLALFIELVSFGFVLRAKLRKEIPKILNRRSIFAGELDQTVRGFANIVTWLKTHSQQELEEKLYYSRKRLEALVNRGGFIFGGLERLGFLPVVVALYLQFKDTIWTWPPELKVNQGFLGLAVFVIYLVGLYFISIKWQLESYIRYLEMATKSAPDTESN